MKKLTEEQIEKINNLSPMDWQVNEQGVFTEPYGIPVHIKEPVIYCRYGTGGVSGGSCWDSSNPQPYHLEEPKDKMKVLDLVLTELCPNISYLQYKKVEKLIQETWKTEYEYYGNSTDFDIQYIVLSDLYKLLETFE